MRTIVVGLLALAILFSVIYVKAVVEPAATRYQSTLPAAVGSLTAEATRLSQLSDKLLLEKDTPSSDERLRDIATLTAESNKLRAELKRFDATSEALPTHPFGFASADYRKSEAIKMQCDETVSQVTEVLDEYDRLLAFLKSYYPIRQSLSDKLANFNSLTDLNVLAYQDQEVTATALTLEQEADAFAKLPSPRGFEKFQSETVDIHRRAAVGFRALAEAISPPIEFSMDAAARQIEAVTADNERISAADFDKALTKSPVLSAVGDLPESTDRFQFPQSPRR
ncbi:MAG TPA: hypothetical protein VF597_03680 [Candidatus Saccharimonadales bacterium]